MKQTGVQLKDMRFWHFCLRLAGSTAFITILWTNGDCPLSEIFLVEAWK
jgi:hypothetical protein